MADEYNEPEGDLIDENVVYSLSEVCRLCGIHAEIINEMIEYSIVDPTRKKQQLVFTVHHLRTIRKALRLRQDFNINLSGVALTLDLLETISELQQKLAKLELQLSAFHSNISK